MGAREPLPLPHLHHHHHHHRLFPPDLPCYDDFSAISGSEKSVSAASDKNVEAPGRDFSSGSSMGESPGPRLKFMCSFGGAILPRPGDGKLRYAGGDTRIVSVHLHISYADLMRKMRQFYGEAVLLKYQLPGEDLDALVSVTSDEDLENMTEEYMKLEASQGPSRLRIFLFSPAENDAVHQNLSAAQTNTDQIYVDAINGVSVAGLKGNLDMAGVSSSKNLRALEALEAWNASQFFENASEAMLGAPIRQRTSASFVQSPNVLSRIMLGSPSPPPPISTVPSQPPQVGQCAIPDLSLNFYPEQLAKIAVRGYELRLDEIHHELEGIGSASRSQLDGPYRPLESRSVSASPTKTQQETMLAPLGKNLNESYPPEQLLMADSRMPRVDSRGRLMTRVDSYGRMPAVNSHSMLMPQQVEQAVSSDRPMDNNIPDILYLPLDVQHLYGQQQLHPSQAACQHPLEVGGDGQLKMDPVDFMQVQQHAQYHYQQITSQHYPLTDKSAREVSAFEQCVQQQEALNGQLPCKSMALQTNHNQFGTKAIPVPVSQLGSAPPSPHMPHWENNMKQNRGHLPVLQSAIGGFVDQPYGKMRGQPHIELANSLLKPANMPLHAQEQLPYIEDQVTFQQAPMPFGNLESLPKVQKGDPFHKENQALHSEFYDLDGVTRAMTPPYPGVTTYQDSSSSFSNCEMSRRDEFANNSCYIDKVHVIVQNTHNHSEEMSGGWTHAHKIDTREVMTSGFVSSQIAETSFVNAPSMRISEPSVGGVAVTDTYLTAQNTRSQFDPLGNTLVHSRSNLVPSAVAQHLPAPGRTLFSDSSQPGGDVLGTQVTMQAGTKILDTSAFPSSFKETVYAPALSIATARNSDVQLDGFGYVQTDSPLSAFPPVSSVSKTESVFLAKMEEGRWTEDSESGFHNPGVHLSEAAYDSTGVLVQDNELNRPASSRTAADPDDTLVKSEVLISKSTSNKSLLDDDTFVPLYSQTETVISNGTSYVIGIGVSTMGLSIFPTDITLSPRASTSAAGGSSVTSPCLNPVVEAFSVSSCLPHPLEDSSRGNLSSTKGVDLVESADMRAEVPVPDLRASITTFGVISVQASQGLEDREVSPRFGSGYVQEFGMHEDEDEGIQGNLEHVAKNVVAAVFKPTLHSSPTLSIQNWENALANVKLDEQVTEESLPVDKSLDEVKVNIDEKEVTFQDAKRGSQEAESDGLIKNKSMNLAAVAEAEAISRGLQTIKNLDLEELRELGSGTFGTVYHGKWRGTDVAIKRIKSSCFSGKPSERERLIADFWKEAYILGQLHHPNVVAFYGVVPDGPGDTLATVTEYMVNGSLKQVLQKKDRTIDRRKRLLIIMDAAFGMEYLHGKNIVHFDLKCENLLVNMKDPHRPICKVGDLGLSKVKHQTMVSGGVRGTLPWMAPELLNGSSNLVSEKVDVFSFGIVMWELLTGEEPYANMHYGAIIGGIVNNTLRPPVPSWCDPSWKSLMERCWSADPEERPAFSNIASELRAMATLASSKAA